MNTLLGQRIREQRKEKGWTIEQFAERVELSANYVGDLERGVKIPPNTGCPVLGVHIIVCGTEFPLFLVALHPAQRGLEVLHRFLV